MKFKTIFQPNHSMSKEKVAEQYYIRELKWKEGVVNRVILLQGKRQQLDKDAVKEEKET